MFSCRSKVKYKKIKTIQLDRALREALNLKFESLTDRHLIEIEVTGPFDDKTNLSFKCTTIRSNPALIGHVTGNATYASFYNSLLGIFI